MSIIIPFLINDFSLKVMPGAVRREIRRNTQAKTPSKTPHLPGLGNLLFLPVSHRAGVYLALKVSFMDYHSCGV